MIAAGDIAKCGVPGAEQTAAVVERIAGTVLTLGDNAYERGTRDEFAACYGPTWGRFKERTKPSPGNHDYATPAAAGYFDYFRVKRWYAFDVGGWRLYSLNSECCIAEQAEWLRRQLRANRRRCVLAYWHRPLFSSGLHGRDPTTLPLWRVLYAARADVVLAGHDHHYERFAPQDPAGSSRPRRGIRTFVVGTGGRSLYPIRSPRARNSVRAAARTYGVLVLQLRPRSYSWRFVRAAGASFSDRGSAACAS